VGARFAASLLQLRSRFAPLIAPLIRPRCRTASGFREFAGHPGAIYARGRLAEFAIRKEENSLPVGWHRAKRLMRRLRLEKLRLAQLNERYGDLNAESRLARLARLARSCSWRLSACSDRHRRGKW
jgi:hypothetical protein